ncbi:DNA double-strand break repair and VJ recombination XRCC4 N-terminal [Penicillium paradoxum]|uniref:DNA double-strand break repair and VJ recombination XRCC4 N-terminal n=1 Tax=Penicillium paradoxum TaxID=176176 RepID=UPI0025471EC0|nr:DNA double-strand break repair and VJ recombination XRCC4 N-terminal [Penicillium paradoxum]KAJ5774290.1 DNA double-strand break repair and VJ recombination XRCC4 N-terminal [Penicillium paradoxum]
MPSRWHRLQVSQKGLPPLLFQYTWTRQGYEFHITDLTYIWSERLSNIAITRRAEEDATTIDPGEDPEQLEVLLEKIGEALQKGKECAILSSGTQLDALEITTTTKLPAPLKPLKWSLKLSKESPSSLTSQLLLPLLKEEAQWESRQRSLLHQLKQKDYVLGKLFDKMETLSVELSSVFPSAAGSRTSRKGITRSEAARFVKGIAPFEEQTWLAEVGSSAEAGLATNLLEEISESDDSPKLDTLAQPQGEWWHQLEKPEIGAREASPIEQEVHSYEADKKKTVAPRHIDTEWDMDGDATASSDDEFQRQDTPPRLKKQIRDTIPSPKQKPRKKSPSPVLPSEADEATASDSDSEPEPAPRQRRIPSVSKSPPSSPPVKAREAPTRHKGGLGMIGGKKKQAKEPSPIPEPPPPPAQAQAAPQRPKGGLGKIGGKDKKEPEPQPQPQPSPSPPTSPAPVREAPKRPKGGLGTIGGKKKQTKEPSPTPEPSPPAHADNSPKRQESPKSEEDERVTSDSVLPTPSAPAAPKAKRSGKLGMIGGKAKAKAPEPAQDKTPLPTSDTVVMSPGRPSPAKPETERPTTKKEESPLPLPKRETASPAEPETEEQRADRKREELKRSLEAKSKAPAKKKRRF